jgi:hypothetical protein
LREAKSQEPRAKSQEPKTSSYAFSDLRKSVLSGVYQR